MNHRDRLIAALPDDMQAGAARDLAGYSPDGNDVVEALFAADIETSKRNTAEIRAELLKLQDALTAAEAREKRLVDTLRNFFRGAEKADQQLLREISHLKPSAPWKRAILGRISTWAAVTVINIAGIVAGIHYLRQTENAELKKIVENPDAWNSFASNSKDAIDAAIPQARAATAISVLIGAPSAQIRHTDGKIAITYPESAITTKHSDGTVTIILNDELDRMRAAFGPDVWQKIRAARDSSKAIEEE